MQLFHKGDRVRVIKGPYRFQEAVVDGSYNDLHGAYGRNDGIYALQFEDRWQAWFPENELESAQ
jgi:hypothetical protein